MVLKLQRAAKRIHFIQNRQTTKKRNKKISLQEIGKIVSRDKMHCDLESHMLTKTKDPPWQIPSK